MNKISITFPNNEIEKSQQQDIFIRTNNAYESFHSLLHSMILYPRPKASELINILKNVEFDSRKLVLSEVGGDSSIKYNSYLRDNNISLPFEKFFEYLKSFLSRECELLIYGAQKEDKEFEKEDKDENNDKNNYNQSIIITNNSDNNENIIPQSSQI